MYVCMYVCMYVRMCVCVCVFNTGLTHMNIKMNDSYCCYKCLLYVLTTHFNGYIAYTFVV